MILTNAALPSDSIGSFRKYSSRAKSRANRRRILAITLAASAAILAPQAAHAANQTWGANGNNAWYTTGNWAGGAFPGLQGAAASNTDIATFTNAFTGTTVGINMGTNSLNLGAISIDNTRTTAANIGNSSTTAGVLRLYGATVNGVANTILRNNGSGLLTLQATQSGTMGVVLSNTTDNIINIDGTGSITISSIISESAAGNKLTLQGAGTGILTLSGANTFSGNTKVNNASKLAIGHNLALQNSAVDTSGTGTITMTSFTTPTIGGLVGSTDLATVFTTGYGDVTTLTLNPSAGISNTYSGAIANAGMILTKTGAGIQALGGTNTYTGGTNVNVGTLTFLNTGAKPATGTTTVAASATLGLGVGGAGFFTSANVDSLFAGTLADVTNNATSNVGIDTSAGDFTYATSVSGSPTNGLAKLGANTLTLTGTNTYTGLTTISGGVLRITNAMSLGTVAGGVTQSGASELAIDGTGGAVIVGDEALSINGGGITNAGALRNIAGNNTYGGTVTLAAQSRINSDSGTLLLNNATAVTATNQNLVVGGAGNITITGAITIGTGGVTHDGGGTLTLSGTNTYTGATTIGSSGTLQIGNGGSTGSIASSSAIANNGTLAFNRSETNMISNTITGSGAITFAGGGNNSLASAGSVVSTQAITVGSATTLTIAAGSTATRTLTNAITLNGGTLQGGVSDNVATVSGLTGGGTSNRFVDANGVTIILKGSGTAATIATLNLAPGVTVTGADELLVGGGGGGGGGRSARSQGGGGGGGRVVLTTGNLTSSPLTLTAGGGGTAGAAQGAAGGAGNTSSIGATTAAGGGGAAAASGNNPTGQGGNSGKNILGTSSTFTGGAGSAASSNSAGSGGAGSSANGSNFVSDTSGGAGGAGTTLSTGVNGLSEYLGSNTFGGGGGGGATSSGGAGGAGGGGSGTTGVGTAGTDVFGGGGGGGNGSGANGGRGGAGIVAIQYAYNSTAAAGTLTLSGGITLSSDSTLDAFGSGGLVDIATVPITGAGGLNITSSSSTGGVVRFSVTNNYAGDTTINSGSILRLNTANAMPFGSGKGDVTVTGTLDLNGNSTQINALSGNGIVNGTSGTPTFTVGNNASSSFGGVIQNSAGTLAMIKTGSGTLSLTGANTYTGVTTVSGGLLTLSNALALQNSTLDTAASNASSSATTGLKTTVTTLTLGGLSGNKDFSTLFDSTNGYGSVTALTLNPGTGATPNYSGDIANGASGMTLTKTGLGSQTLGGANTYTGITTISAGTLKLGATGGATNTPLGTTAAGTTVSGTGTLDLAGFTLGTAEGLSLAGTGTASSGALTNSATTAATYSGQVVLGGASSIVASGGTGANIILSATGTMTGTNTNLTLDGTASASSIASIIGTGSGTLTKQGTGTWTLSGANTYSGMTTISGGILNVATIADSGSSNLGITGGVTLNGGTLQYTAVGADHCNHAVHQRHRNHHQRHQYRRCGYNPEAQQRAWECDISRHCD